MSAIEPGQDAAADLGAGISVVIPVKNEAAGIAACLEGILGQTVPVREIIVIDSGSTDGTQDIVRRHPKTRLIEIPPAEFNHGETRNLGVREARGDFVLMTVGDARPASNEWIENLLAGFEADDVAVVAGAQVVPEAKGTNPLDWFRPVSRPRIEVRRFENQAAFDRSDPETRWRATSLDDVTALYRRRALIEIPFRKAVYGEDVFFALDALSAGWAIAFNPAARVYHYHHESYQTVLKRTIAVASLRYQMTGYLTPRHRFLPAWAKGVARLIRNGRLSWRERLRWARYNHELGKALRDGLALVHDAQARGGDSMQQLHEAYCGTPPVPLKPVPEAQ